jgi:hypothetical protein
MVDDIQGASATGDSVEQAASGGSGGNSVQERLADIYQGPPILDWRYLVAGLAVVAGWWLLFGPFSAFMAGMGMVVLASGIDPTLTALRSRGWPTTEAVVLESTVFTLRELRDSFDGLGRSGSTRGGYVPFVRYEYTVDGETYVNVRVSPFDGPIPRRRWAERIASDYQENTRMTIPYDPSDPSRSFIRTWTWSTRLLLFLGGSTLFLAPAVWLAAGTPLPADIAVPDIVLIGAFASLFILYGLYLMVSALRTYRWPTTRGEVRGRGIDVRSGSEGGSTSYVPQLRYEYEVDGDSYVSSRIAAGSGPSFSSRSGAEDWLEEFPDGGEVTVHYKPSRPDRSVLKRGGVLKGLLLAVVASAALTLVVLLDTGNMYLLERLLQQLLRRLPV